MKQGKGVIVRIAVIFLFFGVFCVQAQAAKTAGEAATNGEKPSKTALIELAKTNQRGLLKKAMAHYDSNINDYTGTLYKQERIRGELLAEQVISFKFREQPFSVFMQWLENPINADRLLYVEGENDNKMVVHPTGFFSWLKSVKRDPRCTDATRWNLYSCDEFGFKNTLQKLLNRYEQPEPNDGWQTICRGIEIIDGREALVLESSLAETEKFKTAKVLVKLDIEHLQPIFTATYDSENNLLSRYIYKDLELNAGLSDEDFTRKANRL